MNVFKKAYRNLFPRKKLELLILLLDSFNEYFQSGFCEMIIHLHRDDKITFKELSIIEGYMYQNRPDPNKHYTYWWTKGLSAPRIEWLKELIEQTKK